MTETPWQTCDGTVCLIAGDCRECGHSFFPPQLHGCEYCGASGAALKPRSVPATGTVIAAVTVHTHPVHPTPFVVADIAVDSHPLVIQATVRQMPDVGDRVIGREVDSDSGPEIVFDLFEGTDR